MSVLCRGELQPHHHPNWSMPRVCGFTPLDLQQTTCSRRHLRVPLAGFRWTRSSTQSDELCATMRASPRALPWSPQIPRQRTPAARHPRPPVQKIQMPYSRRRGRARRMLCGECWACCASCYRVSLLRPATSFRPASSLRARCGRAPRANLERTTFDLPADVDTPRATRPVASGTSQHAGWCR